ncbi:MAG TPA: bifunctional UDP-N-acetylglucosamine diphosphorylase/glucosamine-1-phosphate N-acetyltransferase GlmU [Actinomycetota bacterium]|nr:bifunctional UDP-N-acetylglucosamine diphosphorylase/glucosamine-1-phosphate N-acetyltransferase GlmU [Actinomycetota bacterium]
MATPRRTRTLAAVVMAAGKGKRLKSDTPKVLHPVAGRPSLWHVLNAVRAVRPDRTVVVVGVGKERVEVAVRAWWPKDRFTFVDQGEQLGTAHAVLAAERAVGRAHDVLVAAGDEPLVTAEHLRGLLRVHRRRDMAAVIQTTVPDDARGFGRIIRDGDDFVRIAEGSDATPAELAVTEVGTSVYAFRRDALFAALPLVDRENRQREHYLPDVLGILREKGERIAVQTVDFGGAIGANSRAEIARANAVFRRRLNEAHMAAGVSIVDPETAFVDVGVRIGRDATILPFTFLEGDTRVGPGATVGPSTRLVDTTVGAGATVQFTVANGARIGPRATVGPFTYLRPEAVLEEGSKAGTFVEIKASRVGKGSKVPHLSYVGDARIGRGANIGAGTITVNYDGYEKHPTYVGDGARVGSDTMLVAPVRVGRDAFTGAGSAITRDVPPGALAVERSKQVTVRGYAKRRAETARRAASGGGSGKRARR